MAHQNESSSKRVSRRGLLKAGALAVGSTLLPNTARAAEPLRVSGPDAAIEAALPWYRELVESWAQRKRADFESGRLHACNDADVEAWEDANPKPYDSCFDLFENEIKATIPDDDLRTAYLILSLSPNEATTYEGTFTRYRAVQCVARDVLFLARTRAWYTPTADEEFMGQLVDGEPNVLYGPIPA